MSEQSAQHVADAIAKLGDPQYRKDCEHRTNQHNKLSEYEAEQRHYRAQAKKLK